MAGEKNWACHVKNKMAGEILQKTKWRRPMVEDTIDLQFAIFG
jgi:hypothetical protein